jgi:predicted neutral ceramidase superfamily lipid hydrolase
MAASPERLTIKPTKAARTTFQELSVEVELGTDHKDGFDHILIDSVCHNWNFSSADDISSDIVRLGRREMSSSLKRNQNEGALQLSAARYDGGVRFSE